MTHDRTPIHIPTAPGTGEIDLQMLAELAAGSHHLIADDLREMDAPEAIRGAIPPTSELPERVVSINDAKSVRATEPVQATPDTLFGHQHGHEPTREGAYDDPDHAGGIVRRKIGSAAFSHDDLIKNNRRYQSVRTHRLVEPDPAGVRGRANKTLHNIRGNGNTPTKAHGPKPERQPLERSAPKFRVMGGHIIKSAQRDEHLRNLEPIKTHIAPVIPETRVP